MPFVELAGSQTFGGRFLRSFSLNHRTLDDPNWATAIPDCRRLWAGGAFIQAGRNRLGRNHAGNAAIPPSTERVGWKVLTSGCCRFCEHAVSRPSAAMAVAASV